MVLTKKQLEDDSPIYQGDRGEDFKNLIKSVLKLGKLRDNYIDQLLSPEAMEMYDAAFTSHIAQHRLGLQEHHNYEYFELVGDIIANSCIVQYMSERFRQLRVEAGVAVLARLKINYASKAIFSEISDGLGFWPYITASEQERDRMKKSLLEDVLEAFWYVTSDILDTSFRTDGRKGVGYGVVYDIIRSILDAQEISLLYTDLFDSKTRLKELFDLPQTRAQFGNLRYVDKTVEYEDASGIPRRKNVVSIYTGKGQQEKFWATAEAAKLIDAQQKASEDTLRQLAAMGVKKELSPDFARFCT